MAIVVQTTDNQTLKFEKDLIRIGCSERSDIRLPRDQVESEQAELQLIAGRWLIRSVCGADVHVVGKPPGRMIWLQPGDHVRVNAAGVGFAFQPTVTPEPPQSNRKRKPAAADAAPVKVAPAVQPPPRAVERSPAEDTASRRQPAAVRDDRPLIDKLSRHRGLSVLIVATFLIAAFLVTRVSRTAVTSENHDGHKNQSSTPNDAARVMPAADIVLQDRPIADVTNVTALPGGSAELPKRPILFGYELNGERKLLAQGWMNDSQTVIGSAVIFSELLEYPEQLRMFVHSGENGDPVNFVEREQVRIHPRFDTKDSATLHSGIVSVQLTTGLSRGELDLTKVVASASELVEGQPLTYHGFDVPCQAESFDLTAPPGSLQIEGRISYVSPDTPRIIRVKFPSWNPASTILEGGFVTTASGNIAGTLVSGRSKSLEFYLVTVEQLQGLQQP